MGLGNTTPDDSSNDTEKSDSDLSVSYLYVYEGGAANPDCSKDFHNPDAYPLIKQGGTVRTGPWGALGYGDVHGFFSDLIVGVGDILEEDDYSRILDTLMIDNANTEEALAATEPDAGDLAGYLADHPEVYEDLKEIIEKSEETDSDETESAADAEPADD